MMCEDLGRREFIKNALLTGAGCATGIAVLTGNARARGRYDARTSATPKMRVGRWFKPLPDGRVLCTLCPLSEKLKPGQAGACRVRMARDGKMFIENYGRPASLHLDPLEKNPVYHFMPGTKSLALATAGCNLACPACQNWEISQRSVNQVKNYDLSPSRAVYYAKKNKCLAVTYTFSEPVVFFEYMIDIARKGAKQGLTNHVVSGGYVNPAPLKEMCRYIDSFVISIKGTSDSCYGGRPKVFKTIKNTLKIIKSRGRWLELAILVTPTVNDSDSQINSVTRWISKNLGPFTPVHFSRFYPSFRLRNVPQTPVSTLERALKIAQKNGIKYAYVGNVPGHVNNNTFCHHCGKMLIQRVGFRVLKNNISYGKCRYCGTKIPGKWS